MISATAASGAEGGRRGDHVHGCLVEWLISKNGQR